jgi:hypothetical protein
LGGITVIYGDLPLFNHQNWTFFHISGRIGRFNPFILLVITMAVTPMDLQVIFMQEPAAAKEADKKRRSEEARRSRLANLSRYRSKNLSVGEAESSAAATEVDDEGGGQGGRYRGRFGGQPEEEQNEKPKEEGKGDVMDYEA